MLLCLLTSRGGFFFFFFFGRGGEGQDWRTWTRVYQLVCTHTRKIQKCQSSSNAPSDHSAAGGKWWSVGPAPVSKSGQGVPGNHRCPSNTWVEDSLNLSVGDWVLCLQSLTADFCKPVWCFTSWQSGTHWRDARNPRVYSRKYKILSEECTWTGQ